MHLPTLPNQRHYYGTLGSQSLVLCEMTPSRLRSVTLPFQSWTLNPSCLLGRQGWRGALELPATYLTYLK